MSRSIGANLKTSFQGQTLSSAWCLKLTRADGAILGFTEHDAEILFEGITYEPASGVSLSALASSAQASVDNAEFLAFLESDRITENDLLTGVYDGAEIEVFVINWKSLGDGKVILAKGYLGEIQTGEQFRGEFRDLKQRLQQNVGRRVTPECDAVLGDDRCTKDLTAHTYSTTVVTAPGARTFTISTAGSAGDATYFLYGVVAFTNGDGRNTQREFQVMGWDEATKTVTLATNPPDAIQVGDTLDIIAGCDKRGSTCKNRFSNYVNFTGFPFVPGRDSVLERPSAR